MVPKLYGPIYKGLFSDICPLLSTPDFLVMNAPAQIACNTERIALLDGTQPPEHRLFCSIVSTAEIIQNRTGSCGIIRNDNY
jgi:hypothetical protein